VIARTNIAEAAKRYTTHPPVKKLIDIPQMGDIAQSMLRDALDAFVRRDVTLAHQVLIEPGVLGRGGDARTAAELLLQRARDERALVEIAEDVGQRRRDGLGCDPHRVQLAHDAQPSTAFHGRGRARVGPRHAVVVQGSRFEQVGNRRVDFCGGMIPIEEPRAEPRHRQLAPSEQAQAVEVGRGGHRDEFGTND